MRESWCWLKRRYWAGFCCRTCWALVSLKDDTCQLDATAAQGAASGTRGPAPRRPGPPGARPPTFRLHVVDAHRLGVLHQVREGARQLHGLLLPARPAERVRTGVRSPRPGSARVPQSARQASPRPGMRERWVLARSPPKDASPGASGARSGRRVDAGRSGPARGPHPGAPAPRPPAPARPLPLLHRQGTRPFPLPPWVQGRALTLGSGCLGPGPQPPPPCWPLSLVCCSFSV